jgi:hypothetical protein
VSRQRGTGLNARRALCSHQRARLPRAQLPTLAPRCARLTAPPSFHYRRRCRGPRRYFALTTGANLVLLGSLHLASGGLAAAPPNAVAVLGLAAAASVANWLFIEPVATTLMFSRCAWAVGRA